MQLPMRTVRPDGGAVDYANASMTALGTVSCSYPSGTTAGVVDVTDMAGNVWRVTGTSIKRPGESAAGFSVTRNSSTGIVSSVTRDGVTTSYSRSVSGTTGTMVVTDALSPRAAPWWRSPALLAAGRQAP